MIDLPLMCDCGSFRARLNGITPARVNRIVCYCSDCQAFAHYLNHVAKTLDDHGGTDIFQTSPVRLQITGGWENLGCLRLTAKGALRWYAKCCGSPVGNTAGGPSVPFLGVIHSIVDWKNAGDSAENLIGPIKGAVFQRYATGGKADLIQGMSTPRLFLSAARVILPALLSGAKKNNPLFDSVSGKAIVAPYSVSVEEREKLAPYQNRSAP